MSTRQEGAQSLPVRSRDDLARWISDGEKPKEQWRIGTEHEKFVFHTDTLGPVPYEGERGIRALMESLMERYGWEPIIEGSNIIALEAPRRGLPGGTISLEPGGQFELSGAPVVDLHETAAETQQHLLRGARTWARISASAFSAWASRPSGRWQRRRTCRSSAMQVMTRYMPQVGTRGLDMMYRTATIQVNLDFASEADMVKKLRVSLALQPIATALFAFIAVHRRQAQRLEVAAQRGLARHGPAPHGHAAVRVRGWHGLRALRRLCARRADVLRLPRRALHRRGRAPRSGTSWRASSSSFRASCRRSTIGPII